MSLFCDLFYLVWFLIFYTFKNKHAIPEKLDTNPENANDVWEREMELRLLHTLGLTLPGEYYCMNDLKPMIYWSRSWRILPNSLPSCIVLSPLPLILNTNIFKWKQKTRGEPDTTVSFSLCGKGSYLASSHGWLAALRPLKAFSKLKWTIEIIWKPKAVEAYTFCHIPICRPYNISYHMI